MVAGLVLAVAAWWLRTLPGERLRGVLFWVGRHLPAGLIATPAMIAGEVLDKSLGRGWLGYILRDHACWVRTGFTVVWVGAPHAPAQVAVDLMVSILLTAVWRLLIDAHFGSVSTRLWLELAHTGQS
jgi:hypothetical protein